MATQTAIAKDGIFIPREFLPIGGEWEITLQGWEIVMRPKLSSRLAARSKMDEIREHLQRQYGLFEDSSVLIRQDRDER
jgi:hypothetical protein